jgi:chemotaxis protein CheC
MIKLTEDQYDLLKEVFNLGVGKSAASLSLMAENKYEVILSLPKVNIITLNEMIETLSAESNDSITTVFQKYSGSFSGTAHMIYSQAASLRLVSLIYKSIIPDKMISELETDALMEIGNLLINACLSSLANLFHEEIETSLPSLMTGAPSEIFTRNHLDKKMQVIFIRSEFQIKEENLKGYLSLFLDTEKIEQLLKLIDRYNSELMGK